MVGHTRAARPRGERVQGGTGRGETGWVGVGVGGQITAQIKAWFEWIYDSQMRGEQGRSVRWRWLLTVSERWRWPGNSNLSAEAGFYRIFYLPNTRFTLPPPFFIIPAPEKKHVPELPQFASPFKFAWPPRRIQRRAFSPHPETPTPPSRMAAP